MSQLRLASCALTWVFLFASTAQAQEAAPEPPPPSTVSGTTPPAPPVEPTPTAPEPVPASVLAPSPSPTTPTAPVRVKPRFDFEHAIGAYAHYLFVTRLMFKPYVDQSTPFNGWGTGIQYIRRFKSFDVVTSVDFSWFAVDNGNWLGRGHDPTVDTKYVEFDRLSMLSADVALIGHHTFTNWLEIRGGAGLGIGYVFGNVYTTHNSNQVCTKDNAGDTSKCYPITAAGVPINLNAPDTKQQLEATTDPTQKSSAQNPHRTQEFKPPAMAVLNIMIALNFRMARHATFQMELGFRDAMFCGGAFYFPW